MKNRLILLVFLLPGFNIFLTGQVQLEIDGTNLFHTISPMIQGQGLIYSHEADSIYEDGAMAQTFKDVGAGFLRWPGGTVTTHYHWNDLNGQGWIDNWNPDYDNSKDEEPANYMDLDEYIKLCGETGTEPMLGINMSSGMEWNREEDALNETVALIKYCQSHDFDVQYFYLDNETYHDGNSFNKDVDQDGEGWTAELYAQKINLYSDSIRKYVPGAKLIPNWNRSITSGNGGLKTIINIAGANIDYIDVHWYWKFGVASWEEWKAKSPMELETEWYDGGTIKDEIDAFKNLTTNLGFPNIKLASLEWNIGPGPWQEDPFHTKFRTALMQSEIQMQMMLGGLEIASMWSTQWPGTADAKDRFLVDPDEGYTPNPSAKVFELYKNALKGQLVFSSSSDKEIACAAIIQEENRVFVYLLNKKEVATSVNINMNGYDLLSVNQVLSFEEPGILKSLDPTQNGDTYSLLIPENSLSMIEFQIGFSNLIPVRKYSDRATLEVWPNPASEKANIHTKNFKALTRIEIYNMSGMSVMAKSFNSSHSDQYSLSLNTLSPGSYFIQASDEEGRLYGSKLMIR